MRNITYRSFTLFVSMALALSFGLAGCDLEDLIGDLADGGTGGFFDYEAPVDCLLLSDFVGTYGVTGEPTENTHRGENTASHQRNTIVIDSELGIDFDTGIAFGPKDYTTCYNRLSQEHDRRIQASFGADDDGPVINLYMATGNTVDEIQFRNRNEGINIRVLVAKD